MSYVIYTIIDAFKLKICKCFHSHSYISRDIVGWRLNNLIIGVSDTLPTFNFNIDKCNEHTPGYKCSGWSSWHGKPRIELPCNKKGRYFIVQLLYQCGDKFLSLTEVEVYAGIVSFYTITLYSKQQYQHQTTKQVDWVSTCK